MIKPALNINKAFKDQVTKCMKKTFVAITQPHISKMLAKHNTRVLALLMFYEKRKNPKKVFKVLSCSIYTIISNYVYIYYLASELEKLSEIIVSYEGGFKHKNKSYDKILGIGIPDFLMNLMSCHGVLKNVNPISILKCPKRMLG